MLIPLVLTLASVLPAATQEADPGPTEKALREAYRRQYAASQPEDRAAAVTAYGEQTRALAEGSERLVARTLAGALDDDDLAVRAAAVAQLAWGRHVATVIEALDEALEDLHNEVEKTITRPDAASKRRHADARRLYSGACAALARYADDRAVDVLEQEFKALMGQGGVDSVARSLVVPLAEGLLALGSREAAEIVVLQTTVYTASDIKGTAPWEQARLDVARRLHDALAAFAVRTGLAAPPEFGQNYQQDWDDWLDEHGSALPERLGRLETPPGPPADRYDPRSRPRPDRPERP